MKKRRNTGQPRRDEHSPSTIHGEPARQMKSYTEVRKWMEKNHSPVNDTTSLHLHFLDYDYQKIYFLERNLKKDNNLADKLSNDLKTLCQLTDGIFLTSGAGKIVRSALQKFKLKLNDFDIKGSIAVAIPTMENWRELDGLDSFNHILRSDRKDVQGHLQSRLISAAELDQTKPSICLMVGGGPQTVKRACYALERNIPIILMKGSGGFADLLVKSLANATEKQIEEHLKEVNQTVDDSELMSASCWGVTFLRMPGSFEQQRIFCKMRHLVTVYNPTGDPQQEYLDTAIVKALMKCKKTAGVESILPSMLNRYKEGYQNNILFYRLLGYQQTEGKQTDEYYCEESFQILQMELLKSAISNSSAAVIRHLELSFCKEVMLGCELYKWVTDGQDQQHSGLQGRRHEMGKLISDATDLSHIPLQPEGLSFKWELFLVCLRNKQEEVAEAVLDRMELNKEKIAAALFASATYSGLAARERDIWLAEEKQKTSRKFEQLAIDYLREMSTKRQKDTLLTKVLHVDEDMSLCQLSLKIEAKSFLADEICRELLDCVWHRNTPIVLTEDDESSECTVFSPLVKYSVRMFLQIVFLLLFSYELLFDLEETITPVFIVLAVWVADIGFEEMKQLCAGGPVTNNPFSSRKWSEMFHSYKTNAWNLLECASIVLFFFGFLVVHENEVLRATGRVCLAVDIFLFFIRFLQLLLFFKELGIFLVMMAQSVKDIAWFMLIMLTFMCGYIVASQAVMFPPPNEHTATQEWWFGLLGKGYWQIFDLDLDNVKECQDVPSVNKSETGECQDMTVVTSKYGSYVATCMLGIYVLITNVLLMNLLIAKFKRCEGVGCLHLCNCHNLVIGQIHCDWV